MKKKKLIEKVFRSILSVYWMCSLYYGTCPWSSASYIPAKWLYEWLMQWQLFPSCEYLCKICIFLLVGTVSCSFRCLIHSGKQKRNSLCQLKESTFTALSGKRTVYCPVFNYDFILTEQWHLLLLAYFWEIVQKRGQLISIFPSQGAYKTLCCRPTDLHLICRVKGVWRHLNAYFVNYCKCGFYLWCNVIEYLFILCFFFFFFNITLTELIPALLHLAAYYQRQKKSLRPRVRLKPLLSAAKRITMNFLFDAAARYRVCAVSEIKNCI